MMMVMLEFIVAYQKLRQNLPTIRPKWQKVAYGVGLHMTTHFQFKKGLMKTSYRL